MKRYRWIITIIALGLLLSTCNGTEPEPIKKEPTIIPVEQPTEIPTNTPEPTATSKPTNTPAPTDTPRPTATPKPTDTPTPPPEIIILNGSGDSIVDIEEHGPSIVHIIGNASGRHFSVTNYDANNERIDLLVNTTDPYDGFRPLDWSDDEKTARFEIQITDEWIIEIIPLAPIPEIQEHFLIVPGMYEGNGDDVIILQEAQPDLAIIIGNSNGRHFAVHSWEKYGRDLLVNTSDPYEGTVMLNAETFALSITAEGDWTIKVTAK